MVASIGMDHIFDVDMAQKWNRYRRLTKIHACQLVQSRILLLCLLLHSIVTSSISSLLSMKHNVVINKADCNWDYD